jgi:hypothetical protein
MKRGAAAVLATIGALVMVGPAVASGQPTIEPLGKGYWCDHQLVRGGILCAGFFGDPSHGRIGTVKEGRKPQRNINFKLCAEAPSGSTRCIPRETKHRRLARGTPFDVVRFFRAFPHRLPGTYKLTWWRHGEQLGGTLRFKLEP